MARSMKSAPTLPQRANWHVRWKAKGRIVGKAFGNDIASALVLYDKAKAANKPGVTLICKNLPFDPPERFRPRMKRGRSKITRRIVEVYVEPLQNLNAQEGVWWCPYCIKLRRFVRRKGFYVDGIWVPEQGYHCPVCDVSHRDGGVRKWNPLARKLFSRPPGSRKQRN